MNIPAPTAPRLPASIGRYRVTSRLGKGAMGIVYAAHDDQMERDVAIKIMMADLEGEPETLARFLREAQITSKLLHRNIITVLDLGEEDGRPFIVMELLKGQTLGDYLKDTEKQSLEQKLDLMIQTCEGMSVAHAKGIVHRDLKPGNLFVQPDGGLKILDFGVARLINSSITASGLIVGTPDYMSPEQARGRPVDSRSDVFSAAAVFYFMLTGRKPFPGPDLPVVLEKVIKEDPLPIREHEGPETLARIVLRALSKDPASRYQKFADMAADLVRFKRQFDGETRVLATTAKQRFDEVLRAAATGRELGAKLRVRAAAGSGSATSVDEKERGIRERHPFFIGDVPGVPPALAPLRRNRLMGILSDLDTVLVGLSTQNDAWRSAVKAAEQAEAALKARDIEKAIERFEAAEQLAGTDADRVTSGLAASREAAATVQAARQRLDALVAEMAAAEKRADWRTVDELSREILAIDPHSREAALIAPRARAALAAEADARWRKIQQLVAQANKAYQGKRFDEAERLLDEARALDPDAGAIRQTATRVNEARVVAAALDAASRRAAQEIASARETFASGARDAAIARLDGFARDTPDAPGIAAELVKLRDEAARLAVMEHRVAQARTYARQAETHWQKNEVAEALNFAELALSLSRTEEAAIHIQGLARARLREQAETAARAAEASAAVAKAVEWLAGGQYDKAEREAQRALELQAGRTDAAGVLSEARRLHAEADAERQRRHAAAEREREVEKNLNDVRLAMQKRDYGRAMWAAENALLIDPDHAEAQRLLAEARAAATPEPAPADDDGTVPALPVIDPDDTAVIRQRAALKGLAVNVGGWASSLRRKFQEPQR
jgi:tetratricopeptide (TPR) repeat protein/predicted Ser/Thr protein kinase